jgi:CRP/FNR family cyclic AMP-dependent transcriptional regulator
MFCTPVVLKQVPLFALLDDDEAAVLAGQVELRRYAPRQRIYKMGDSGDKAYILVSGAVQVTTVDEDHQEVLVDQPAAGEFFGFASMLEQTPHQTNAVATDDTVAIEVDRNDILVLLQRKPHAGMDMLTVLGRQFHASQQLVRIRASRNPNVLIEEKTTFGERIADAVAGFGGSWTFIIAFAIAIILYSGINVSRTIRVGSVSVYFAESVPFNACRDSGACDHDEPEPAGHERPAARRAGFRRQPAGGVRNSGLGAEVEPAGR